MTVSFEGDVEPRIMTLRYSPIRETSANFQWTIDIPDSVMIVSFDPEDVSGTSYAYPNETGVS